MGRTPYLGFLGQASQHDEELARRALSRVNALQLADRPVGELSGGECQRVLLLPGWGAAFRNSAPSVFNQYLNRASIPKVRGLMTVCL